MKSTFASAFAPWYSTLRRDRPSHPRTLARRAAVTALIVPLIEAAVLACPICFQTADAHLTSGVRAGVAVLIAVTVGVVSACVVFFGRVIKRQ